MAFEEASMRGARDGLICTRYTERGAQTIHRPAIREASWVLYVNGQEWVTFLCTPTKMQALVLGFLLSEGIIEGLDDVLLLRVCDEEGMIDVRLKEEITLPTRQILTSGCGAGITFDDLSQIHPPLDSSLTVTPAQVFHLMAELNRRGELYRTVGGVHTSALSDGQDLLVIAEDVGRHNTLDKIRGECLLRGIPTADRIILTTGRLSSEMMTKTVKMGVPIVISRTAPTDLAVELARRWGITLIGYVRGRRMDVYTDRHRIRLPWETGQAEGLRAAGES
ncbi:MAG TPA: formate dehydrogenase accessory sulfurtransferase FdhD [Anaerolineae bacterium]|nr:formate dehydrogenase accessory sulfurtransferase FdhD [Anaerolineae bacterium]